jgi:hypothetical protein
MAGSRQDYAQGVGFRWWCGAALSFLKNQGFGVLCVARGRWVGEVGRTARPAGVRQLSKSELQYCNALALVTAPSILVTSPFPSLGVVVQSWTVLAWPPALAPLYVMARLRQPGPVLCGGLRGAAVAEPTNGSAVKVTLQTNNPPRRSVRRHCGQLFGHLLACFKATSPAAMCNTEESWTKLISLREFSVRLGMA